MRECDSFVGQGCWTSFLPPSLLRPPPCLRRPKIDLAKNWARPSVRGKQFFVQCFIEQISADAGSDHDAAERDNAY
jgi:hypothetical protein